MKRGRGAEEMLHISGGRKVEVVDGHDDGIGNDENNV
jgi:hypothetical protein